jgi:hypothetical protein
VLHKKEEKKEEKHGELGHQHSVGVDVPAAGRCSDFSAVLLAPCAVAVSPIPSVTDRAQRYTRLAV